MNKLLVAVMGAALLVGVGCQKDNADSDGDVTVRTESTRTDTMRGDDCAMCEGTQTARADGKCPQCGMTLRPAAR